jgi:pilus assembly protein CpaE
MPFVQVVVLSVQGDQNYMRRAMQVGAGDFLVKPPIPDELVAAIRRAGKTAQEERSKGTLAQAAAQGFAQQPAQVVPLTNSSIIMIYSPKGGNGCTTIAVNLAVALHNDETRVALVDANFQFGDVASFLNEQGKNTVLDLASRTEELDPDIVSEVMIKHAASGIHILASPSRPENAEKVGADQFVKLLRYLRQIYAYVIVDTTSFLNDITLSVLDTADLVLLITTQDFPSIKNDHLFLELLPTLGIPSEKVMLVMNRYDKRIAVTPEKIGENLKREIMVVIPLDERTVITSVNRGIPFMLDNKTQPAARGIYSLVEAIRTRSLKHETEDAAKPQKR